MSKPNRHIYKHKSSGFFDKAHEAFMVFFFQVHLAHEVSVTVLWRRSGVDNLPARMHVIIDS